MSKLWLAFRNLASEENQRRKEFNASKYFQNVIFDDQLRELRKLLPIAEDTLQGSWLEETKVAPSIVSSLRAFVTDGTLFRSIDYRRNELQSLVQEVQTQMKSCRN